MEHFLVPSFFLCLSFAGTAYVFGDEITAHARSFGFWVLHQIAASRSVIDASGIAKLQEVTLLDGAVTPREISNLIFEEDLAWDVTDEAREIIALKGARATLGGVSVVGYWEALCGARGTNSVFTKPDRPGRIEVRYLDSLGEERRRVLFPDETTTLPPFRPASFKHSLVHCNVLLEHEKPPARPVAAASVSASAKPSLFSWAEEVQRVDDDCAVMQDIAPKGIGEAAQSVVRRWGNFQQREEPYVVRDVIKDIPELNSALNEHTAPGKNFRLTLNLLYTNLQWSQIRYSFEWPRAIPWEELAGELSDRAD